jgi:hypothetical protein
MSVPVGQFSASVTGTGTFRGVPVYIIELRGGTNRFASLLYRINDRFVSYVDKKTLRPLKFEESRRERFYKKDAVTVFDRARGKAYFHNYHDGSYKTYAIPEESYDVISVFYHLRRASLSAQMQCAYSVAFAENVFDVWGTLSCVQQLALSDDRNVDVYYTEPCARVADKPVQSGAAGAYISSDEQIPVRIVVKAPLFTRITAVLCPPGEPPQCT